MKKLLIIWGIGYETPMCAISDVKTLKKSDEWNLDTEVLENISNLDWNKGEAFVLNGLDGNITFVAIPDNFDKFIHS